MEQNQKSYQYVVIGAGSGGLTVAVGLHRLGKQVLLVSENIGGECTFSGCVPSKSFLKLAKSLGINQSDPGWSEKSAEIFDAVRATIERFAVEDEQIVQKIPKIIGRAKFVDRKTLLVGSQKIKFGKCVIATGSRPVSLKITGLNEDRLLTNENVFNLKVAPRGLTIIGGGPIGCEMATAFADLGTKVKLVTRGKILPKDSEGAVSLVRKSLLKKGVQIYEDSEVEQVLDGKALLSNGTMLDASEYYLIALGRVANTKLELEKAEIDYGDNGIFVDEYLRTSCKGVWAIGDCTTAAKFTHLAYYHATKVVTQQISRLLPMGKTVLPWVTFTAPMVAAVGINRESVRVKKFEIPFAASDRAKIENDDELYGELYVDAWSGRIVGATLVGIHAEHYINFYTLAILQKTSVWKLLDMITPYPTFANAMNKVVNESVRWWIKRLPQTAKEILKDNLSRIVVAFFWISSAIVMYLVMSSYNFDIRLITQELYVVLQSPLGVLLFIALYCARPIISFSATVLSAIAGSVYGFELGLLLTVIASNSSSIVAYYLGRGVFAPRNNYSMSGFAKRLQKNTFQATLTARLTYLPYDLVSYVAGALKVPLTPFVSATALGSIPGSIAVVAFGASLENLAMIETFKLDAGYVVLGLLALVLSLAIRKVIK